MHKLSKHKIYYIFSLLLITLSLLITSCGASNTGSTPTTAANSPSPSPSGASPSPSSQQNTPSASPTQANNGQESSQQHGKLWSDKPVSIEIYATVGSTEVGPPPKNWFWYDAVKKATNIDVKISWITDPSQYTPTLQTRAGANDLPDLFTTDRNTLQQLVQQGLVADWSPYLKYMPNFVKDRDVNELAKYGTFDGKHYGLVTKNAYPYKGIVIIRQDWLDKLGLKPPKTTDEYLEVMKAFTEKDPDGNGKKDTYGYTAFIDDNGQISGFDPFFAAFGAQLDWKFEKDQVVPMRISDQRRQALEFINKMVNEGVLDPDWKTQQGQDYANKWKTGKVGIFAGDWCAIFCRQGYQEFARANPNGKMVIIDPPVGPNGDSAAGTYSRLGNMYVMSKKAADAGKGEAIARLLEWIDTDGYYLTAFGQEEVNWKRDSQGHIVPGPKSYLDPENLVLTQLRAYAYKGTEEELRARYDNTYKAANGQTISVWSVYQRALKLPKLDTTNQAIIPPAPPEISADLTRTMAEAELKFATGQRPFSDWPNYVNQVKSMGLDQWTEMANQAAAEAGLIKK